MAPLVARFAALAGLVLSGYALYVEHEMASAAAVGEEYEALCDFKEGPLAGASCSAVFDSGAGRLLSYFGLVERGSLFDVSNAAAGCGYYGAVLLHQPLARALGASASALLLVLGTSGALFSVYLAYLLAVVLKDFCVVCAGMHACNVAIFCAAIASAFAASRSARSTTKAKKL